MSITFYLYAQGDKFVNGSSIGKCPPNPLEYKLMRESFFSYYAAWIFYFGRRLSVLLRTSLDIRGLSEKDFEKVNHWLKYSKLIYSPESTETVFHFVEDIFCGWVMHQDTASQLNLRLYVK